MRGKGPRRKYMKKINILLGVFFLVLSSHGQCETDKSHAYLVDDNNRQRNDEEHHRDDRDERDRRDDDRRDDERHHRDDDHYDHDHHDRDYEHNDNTPWYRRW
jgi:hypothetical protein